MTALHRVQLCAGSVRSKNTMNILLKNVIDGCVSAIFFYFFGFALAFGTSGGEGNSFIGTGDFALSDTVSNGNLNTWFFQWAFAAATATIVSGSVAERCSFEAYVGYSAVLSGFVYPVIAHWCAGSSVATRFLHPVFSDPERMLALLSRFGSCGAVHRVSLGTSASSRSSSFSSN